MTDDRKMGVHFSSASEHWSTPKELYDALDKEFHFDFDPCPLKSTFDGLSIPWGESNFCNPPYGRKIGMWMYYGLVQNKSYGRGVVFLIPSRTDTKWWHSVVMQADEVRFLRGRLKFGGAQNSAPFPSALAIFRKRNDAR